MTGDDASGSRRAGGGRLSGTLSNAGLGVTLVAVLAIGGLVISQALPPDTGAKPTPSGGPSTSSQASPADTPPPGSEAPPSPAATVGPSPALIGVFPGPDATIPPGASAVIPGLRIEAVAAAAAAAGLTCASDAGAYPGGPPGYILTCEGQDPAAHATFGLSVTYWTLDALSDISLYVWSDGSGTVLNPAAPIRLFSRFSDLSAGSASTKWVLGHLDDQACTPCTKVYGTVHLELHVGVHGGRVLHIREASG